MNKILPRDYNEKYNQLLNQLLELQKEAIAPCPPISTFTQNCQDLQDFYQEYIFSLTGEEVPLEIVSRWRSLHTEIHRAIKLLAMDSSLLKAARSPEMQSQRQKGLGDRLSILINYCRAILS